MCIYNVMYHMTKVMNVRSIYSITLQRLCTEVKGSNYMLYHMTKATEVKSGLLSGVYLPYDMIQCEYRSVH